MTEAKRRFFLLAVRRQQQKGIIATTAVQKWTGNERTISSRKGVKACRKQAEDDVRAEIDNLVNERRDIW